MTPTTAPTTDLAHFKHLAASGAVLIPIARRITSDQITPVIAYRRLVKPDQRLAPSFLLESVVGGDRVGRYSYLGAQPAIELIARGNQVTITDHQQPDQSRTTQSDDPLAEVGRLTDHLKVATSPGLPDFAGGWVGLAGYDTVRYLEGQKLGNPPNDDRNLPDLHMGFYRQIVAFDHVQKTIVVINHARLDQHKSPDDAYHAATQELDALIHRIVTPPNPKPQTPELLVGNVDTDQLSARPDLAQSNMGQGGYQDAVRSVKEYIAAGDAFQVVPSQRFELKTNADPFDIYRTLRVVNPSPYMFYVQIEGAMLVGSSPEILCRVQDGTVTSRPLAGTRHRGKDTVEDQALEAELLADPKECAEHVMLVDLGRNDVGRVADPGSIDLPRLMEVERYSHVMHISSTVTGKLKPDKNCWDALRFTLPVGTVSGAPKVRAMQIIDELEPTRRGPYAGAVGYVDLQGNMDMAIALRTMVVMPNENDGQWTVHIQAGSGIVADSDPDTEHQETVNKAAALAQSVKLAERMFNAPSQPDPEA